MSPKGITLLFAVKIAKQITVVEWEFETIALCQPSTIHILKKSAFTSTAVQYFTTSIASLYHSMNCVKDRMLDR